MGGFGTMSRRGVLVLAVLASAVLSGGASATADEVWLQSYERSGPEATCDDPPETLPTWRNAWDNPTDPLSGPSWHPGWSEWPGGWTRFWPQPLPRG